MAIYLCNVPDTPDSPDYGPAGPVDSVQLLFPETHPHADGPSHCAAYLANTDGSDVELAADDAT
jgi:hypothetical protein